MSWIRNGLLLAAGGFIGLLAGCALMDDDRAVRHSDKGDGMELLIGDIRREAEAALAACETEEEREAVYAQIRDSVEKLREELQTKGDALITELQEGALTVNAAAGEPSANDHVQAIRDTLQKVSQSLDETLETLKPPGGDPAMGEGLA